MQLMIRSNLCELFNNSCFPKLLSIFLEMMPREQAAGVRERIKRSRTHVHIAKMAECPQPPAAERAPSHARIFAVGNAPIPINSSKHKENTTSHITIPRFPPLCTLGFPPFPKNSKRTVKQPPNNFGPRSSPSHHNACQQSIDRL